MKKWLVSFRLRLGLRAICTACVAFFVSAVASSRAANLLLDPGFEDNPPGADVHPISGWQSYGANNFTESDGHAHTGANYYKVYGQFTASDNYTGLYQDNPATPGNTYSADGWAFSLSSDGGGIHGQDQIWLEVTFRDAALNTVALYRSAIISGANIGSFGGLDQWFKLPITNAWSFTNSGGVPIAIGKYGRERVLLVSAEEHRRLKTSTRRAKPPPTLEGTLTLECSPEELIAGSRRLGDFWVASVDAAERKRRRSGWKRPTSPTLTH